MRKSPESFLGGCSRFRVRQLKAAEARRSGIISRTCDSYFVVVCQEFSQWCSLDPDIGWSRWTTRNAVRSRSPKYIRTTQIRACVTANVYDSRGPGLRGSRRRAPRVVYGAVSNRTHECRRQFSQRIHVLCREGKTRSRSARVDR
jgi:hypothetical protein